jgi:hypothetical protein
MTFVDSVYQFVISLFAAPLIVCKVDSALILSLPRITNLLQDVQDAGDPSSLQD